MSLQILTTKLYIPAPRAELVRRGHLIERLNRGVHNRLILISAPAGFGKTTLVSEWIASCEYPVAWLSLDELDNDPHRFLAYFVASLQTIASGIGDKLLQTLMSPQPPPIDSLLTSLVNVIATIPDEFFLVLDDYHILDEQQIDNAMSFLLEHLPPQMHLVMTTREDPQLPLARLRARGQLTEIRASDLRFSIEESSQFLSDSMGLADLSMDNISALDVRTEGWIAGLQLAAISMQNQADKTAFVDAFTGSHQYVLDYLLEEVLQHQPESIQMFLLQTSTLERFCADLCDTVTGHTDSQEVLDFLVRANLFLIPLDHERQWFRYHHLFGDLLRQRLQKTSPDLTALYHRASLWYEQQGYELDAFNYAAMTPHIERAERLVMGEGVPLYFRGMARPVLHWLESLPDDVLDTNLSLQVMYCWVLKAVHQNSRVGEYVKRIEPTLNTIEPDETNRDLIGQLAAIRAMLATNLYRTDEIIEQSHRALDLLSPNNIYVRTVVMRTLAVAYQFQGDRVAARDTYLQAIHMSEVSNNLYVNILSTTGLGIIQLSDNQLIEAEKTFLRVLELVGEPAQPIACAAYLRLTRIYYEWNDLDAAQQYGEKGVELARQIDTIDTATSGEIFLAKLKLVQGDLSGTHTLLSQLEQVIAQRQFTQQIPALIEVQVRLLLQQGDIVEASRRALSHDLPLSQARVLLAQGQPDKALDILSHYHQQMEEQDWVDERLKLMLLQALAYQANKQLDKSLQLLQDVIRLTQTEGFIRLFVDEGKPMNQLLLELSNRGFMSDYIQTLCRAFDDVPHPAELQGNQTLIEPLSERELEILQLIADGLSNRQISDRLYLALSTVKGHNSNIYGKLGVSRRIEAVSLARELGLVRD